MNGISYSVVAEGSSGFLRAFSIPLADELEKVEGLEYKPVPHTAVFEHDARVRAHDVSMITGIVGVLLFLPGWFALKALNEVYDIKIKPVVRNLIQKCDSIELFSSKKRDKVFALEIYIEELNVLVILAAKEKSPENLRDSAENLPELLPSALRQIEENGCRDEVHLYVLSRGKVNREPHIHGYLESAHRELNT